MDIDADADDNDEVRSMGSDGYRSDMGEEDENQHEFGHKGGREQIRLKDIDPNRDLQPYITLMNPKVTRKHPRLILPPGTTLGSAKERKYESKVEEEEDEDRTRTPSPATTPKKKDTNPTSIAPIEIGKPVVETKTQVPQTLSTATPAPALVATQIPAGGSSAPIPETLPERPLPVALQSHPPPVNVKEGEILQPVPSIDPAESGRLVGTEKDQIKMARYTATVPKMDEGSDRKDLEIALGTSPHLLVNSWLHYKANNSMGIIDERALTLPPAERLKGTHATTGRKLELGWAGSLEATVGLLTMHQNVDLRRAVEWQASSEQMSRLSALHAGQASIMLDVLTAKRRLPVPGGDANPIEYAAAQILIAKAGQTSGSRSVLSPPAPIEINKLGDLVVGPGTCKETEPDLDQKSGGPEGSRVGL